MSKVKASPAVRFGIPGLLCVAFLAGCSDSEGLGRVTGVVTLDGKPLSEANVEFVPSAGGRPSTAVTDSEGRYELLYTMTEKGAAIGEHKVIVSTLHESDGKLLRAEQVPMKYNLESTLTKMIASGGQTVDLQLDSKGKIYSPQKKRSARKRG